mmetsp:Transcript_7003/g.11078  ORF Transcript_7003/g.11078 Transcript_7003/m.11078 type:complete len:244 (-) Transcript_7003:97-828(-)
MLDRSRHLTSNMRHLTNIVACLFVSLFDFFGNANRDVSDIWTSAGTGRHISATELARPLASLLLTLQPVLHRSHVRLGEKVQRFQPARLAGFGKPKESVAPLPAEPKKQWDIFKRIIKKQKAAGENGRKAVFCRPKGDTMEWVHVGDVAISKEATIAGAVQLHKDLIKKHAGRVFAKMKVGELEIAYTEAPVQEKAEKIIFAEDVVAPSALKECGFEGEADPSGHYKASKMPSIYTIDSIPAK